MLLEDLKEAGDDGVSASCSGGARAHPRKQPSHATGLIDLREAVPDAAGLALGCLLLSLDDIKRRCDEGCQRRRNPCSANIHDQDLQRGGRHRGRRVRRRRGGLLECAGAQMHAPQHRACVVRHHRTSQRLQQRPVQRRKGHILRQAGSEAGPHAGDLLEAGRPGLAGQLAEDVASIAAAVAAPVLHPHPCQLQGRRQEAGYPA
mmetsp:Transcript_19365/g.58529  ORF Transcript_19365/g.58529 Transcript_19365/m.58529 type:complete len:204 (+) Transcript_19365:704-1315(+)